MLARSASLLVAIALASGCGGGSDHPERWHVAGGHLRDAEGRAVILRGANVSSRHKSPPYFDFHQRADFDKLSEWGMNSVRFLISWAAIEPERGLYDAAYLDGIAERVDWLEAAGILVILDMHQDLYGEGFGGNGAPRWTCEQAYYDAFEPVEPWFANYGDDNIVACYDNLWASADLLDHYEAAWRRVAERLADSPAIIGIDPMNEPFWGSHAPGTFEEEILSALYERVIAAVRESAPAWVAFTEPSASRNLGFTTSLPRFSFRDVVYAPHSYDPQAESGDGFDEARRVNIIEGYTVFRQEAGWLDAGLWIGEYGGIASAPGIAAYMDAQYDGAGSVAAGSCYWHYSKDGGYGLLDADGNEKPELLAALVRPYPARVAGAPLSYAYDEATRILTVRYTADRALAAVTEIIAPERVYPDGATVDCSGCEFEASPGLIRIITPPSDDPAEIAVRPR